jgi:hypothetical protein
MIMAFYEPLPRSSERLWIRLLEIEPASHPGDALQATLATYDLKNPYAIDYDALSYCWGKPGGSESITINGEEFAITQSLASALRQLRALDDDQRTLTAGPARKLWVDAVCINQSHNAEKSHQVGVMRDIYANARRVFSWLGDVDKHSHLAFDTLRRFTSVGAREALGIASSLLTEAKERRAAIKCFTQLPYFFRMWIVQEVVAAKEVVLFWGPHTIGFDAACEAMERITGSNFYPFSTETANISYVRRWRQAYHARDLKNPGDADVLDLRLFVDTRGRTATDPRDKIYSLCGITGKTIAAGIRVDYDEPVRKVYTDFSKHVLRTRPDLQLLSAVMVKHTASCSYGLPSYVPDWMQPRYGGGFLQRYFRFKPTHLFRASGDTKPRVTIGEGGGNDAITVEGFRFDTISRVIPVKSLLPRGELCSTEVTEAVLYNLADDAISTATYPPTAEPAWMAYLSKQTNSCSVHRLRLERAIGLLARRLPSPKPAASKERGIPIRRRNRNKMEEMEGKDGIAYGANRDSHRRPQPLIASNQRRLPVRILLPLLRLRLAASKPHSFEPTGIILGRNRQDRRDRRGRQGFVRD